MPNDAPTQTDPLLTPIEARVLGCLMEKQRTTPDQYPLTLNALVTACNQKSSRNPIMRLDPGEVGHTVNRLRDRDLVHASFAGRTERYDHKMVGALRLSRQEQALLCVLMLRGPQTAGELRSNTGRMADFADLETVAETLRGLATRDGPLVIDLPRLPGRREERYMHLLCGAPTPEQIAAVSSPPTRSTPVSESDERVAALEAEVEWLRADLDRLWDLSGLSDRREA